MSSPSTAIPTVTRGAGRLYPPPPLSRWSIVWRYLLAVAMGLPGAAAYVVAAVVPDAEVPSISPAYIALDLGLAVVAAFVVGRRRAHPMAVAAILASFLAFSAASAGFAAWAYVSLCTRRRPREQIVPAALLLGSTVASWFVLQPLAGLSSDALGHAWELVFSALWIAIYTAIGWYVGARRDLLASLRERAETAEREQALRTRQVQADERARLAREMHDSLAHRMSLVSLHAGALSYRTDLTPEETREIARTIQESAHEALGELRAVLSDLRHDVPEAPQPTLADLPRLVDEAREAGVPVELDDGVDPRIPPPAGIARHAYRIVQEALTNARKHAAGARVFVHLAGEPGAGLSIEVRNPLSRESGVPGAGYGIVGLGERAQLAGGTLSAAPERGDFVVKAWLPWEK
jgi:signal transduction histidine kinase